MRTWIKGGMSMSVYLKEPRFLHGGESCIVAEFADEIDRAANDAVMNLRHWMESQKRVPIVECLPTYRSLAIYFDPLAVNCRSIIEEAGKAVAEASENVAVPHKIISIPVCYGGEYGPDIDNVAGHAGISVEEVIRRHSSKICHCYMIGFVPGFAYLGGMDGSIATPRLADPRTVIPGGSVGIAGKQTGIYPIDCPGGWQLIGRTPLRLFTPECDPPTLIEAGYEVRFVPITENEYRAIEAQVANGTYRVVITEADQ